MIGTTIRTYGLGGVFFTSPTSKMGSKTSFGGWGTVGVEFFRELASNYSMFMELGGMGSGVTADKLVGKPLYANGFIASWGGRFFL